MFKLTLKTDNAAFEYPEIEVARILRHIAAQVCDGSTFANCHDVNGNTVGYWEWCLKPVHLKRSGK